MAGKLTFESVLLLRWTLDRPLRPLRIESCAFSFQNDEWNFLLDFRDTTKTYWLVMQKISAWTTFPSFEHAAWFEDGGGDKRPLNFIRLYNNNCNFAYVWHMKEAKLLEEMSGCEGNPPFTFFCLLHPSVKVTKNQSTQTSSDEATESELGSPSRKRRSTFSC